MTASTTIRSAAEAEGSNTSAMVLTIGENGILAGILGATLVALWFLILDIVSRGVPFFTPSLLGSIIFAGKSVNEVTGLSGAAVFAYSGLHGILFLLAGTVLAWMFMQFERNPDLGLVLLLLFVTFEAIVWGIGITLIPALAGVVGTWAILVANVSSAIAMFAFLLRRYPLAMESLRRALNE